ncbi:MAG: DUF3310 domain-containing protein [Erysipelotrichaceae bacterium]
MSELKTNKFKVGDKVEIVSVNSTVAEYGGDDYLAPIGTIDNISWMNDDGLMIELESSDYIYSTKDLRLIADEEIGLLNGGVPEKDNVNQPQHYASQSIECIVAMEAMLSPEEFIGYLRGKLIEMTFKHND